MIVRRAGVELQEARSLPAALDDMEPTNSGIMRAGRRWWHLAALPACKLTGDQAQRVLTGRHTLNSPASVCDGYGISRCRFRPVLRTLPSHEFCQLQY